jgi:hypothetical protein
MSEQSLKIHMKTQCAGLGGLSHCATDEKDNLSQQGSLDVGRVIVKIEVEES